MSIKTYKVRPNTPIEGLDTSSFKIFDFVGVGKRNKGKTYRSYAATHADAVNDIVFGYRLSPRDIKPLNHKATDLDTEYYCHKCDIWHSGDHSH